LTETHVTFGRCCITGEWGKCLALDLGDIAISAPDTTKGVNYNPDTGEVTFTVWKPVVFASQALFSEKGFETLLEFIRNQENPVPKVTPILVYQWRVLYTDGSTLSQFQVNPETGFEEETNSGKIDYSRLVQMSLVPRNDTVLPTYTFVRESGKFFKNGEELDVAFDGPYIPHAEVVYGRKVTTTWSSGMEGQTLDRNILNVHAGVVQLLGWKIGGLPATIQQTNDPGCVIGIDERGNFRPWHYVE
jgi:hypothetical protein